MGLFSRKKEQTPNLGNDPNTQTMPDFNNLGLGQNQNQYNIPSSDPMNSGLKLADLNSQGMGFNQQESPTDSFGNPRVQPRTESYEYSHPQQFAPQDNKDIQLILSKLDTIKSEITNINHRLDNIERAQKEPTQQKKYPW
jgi:hypothetical protein